MSLGGTAKVEVSWYAIVLAAVYGSSNSGVFWINCHVSWVIRVGSLAMAAYEVNRDGALRILRDRIPNPLRAIGSCMRVVRWLSASSVICMSWRKWEVKMVTLVVWLLQRFWLGRLVEWLVGVGKGIVTFGGS